MTRYERLDINYVTAGSEIESASTVLIMLHGRGATAESILSLFSELNLNDAAAIAPQAENNSWYPLSFMAPVAGNQPWLDAALNRVESIINNLIKRNISPKKIVLMGFSQGACLASEYMLRYPRSYGALLALSGGVIGNGPSVTDVITGSANTSSSLVNVPVFLGSSDPDSHVPFSRVEETAAIFKSMGAAVDLRRYPNGGHFVNDEQLAVCRLMLEKIIKNG